MSRYNEKTNTLVVYVEEDFWWAFSAGKTNQEVYLPATPQWEALLMDPKTKKMQKERKGMKVVVQCKRYHSEGTLEDVSTRWVPIRRFERADKHLVLQLMM